MNKSFARYDYQKKTIVCSKQFLVLAGQFGTPEFHQLMDMRSKQPTFTVEEYKPERNTEKKTYGKLTYLPAALPRFCEWEAQYQRIGKSM